MSKVHKRQIILDTETTGFNPEEGHRIVEFAALEMIDRQLTGEKLHLYINPEREIDEAATQVHGIRYEDVKDEPVFKDRIQEIIEFVKDSELIIHNAKFDMNFLNYQFNLEKNSLPGLQAFNTYISGVVDTLMMARFKFPGGRNSLDALCDRFEVDRSNRKYHGALIDCELLAEVYLALTREQTSFLDANVSNKTAVANDFITLDTLGLNLKITHPSLEEIELHNKYLQDLDKASQGKSIWFNQAK